MAKHRGDNRISILVVGNAVAARITKTLARAYSTDPIGSVIPDQIVVYDSPQDIVAAAIAARQDAEGALDTWCDQAEAALAIQRLNRTDIPVFAAREARLAWQRFVALLGLVAPDPAPNADTDPAPLPAIIAQWQITTSPRASALWAELRSASQRLGNATSEPFPVSLAEAEAAWHGVQDTEAALIDLRMQITTLEARVATAEAEAHDARVQAQAARTGQAIAEERSAFLTAIQNVMRTDLAEAEAAENMMRTALTEAEAAKISYQQEIEHIMTSRSMRITAPLRLLAGWLRPGR